MTTQQEMLYKLYMQKLAQQEQQQQNKSGGQKLLDYKNTIEGYADKANKLGDIYSRGKYYNALADNAPANTALSNAINSEITGNTAGNTALGNALASEMAGNTAGSTALGDALASEMAGSAAGGAGAGAAAGMAAGPIGALAALGGMVLDGNNRNAAKQRNAQNIQAAQQRLQNTQQHALNSKQQANNALAQGLTNAHSNNGTITGAASPISNIKNLLYRGNNSNAVNNIPLSYEGSASQALGVPESQYNTYGQQANNAPGLANIQIPDTTQQTSSPAGTLSGIFRGIKNRLNSQNAGNTILNEYQNYLRDNGYDENVVNGVAQGLNNGDAGIASWINQYNNSAAGQQAPINIPQTDEEVAAAQAGNFNAPIQAGRTKRNRGLMDYIADGISDFAKGYQENRSTGFAPENLTQKQFKTEDENGNETTSDKGVLARLGETTGTIGRMAQNPWVQALTAGIAGGALTGNPLYGLGLGYKYGNQRANSNTYQNALAENGVNVNPGVLGNLTSTDMNTLMTPTYKQMDNDLKEVYYDALARNNILTQDIAQQRADETARHNKATEYQAAQANANKAQQEAQKAQEKAQKEQKKEELKNEYNSNVAKYGKYYKQLAGTAEGREQLRTLKQEMVKQYGSSVLKDLENIEEMYGI